jgi:hypothetical protein
VVVVFLRVWTRSGRVTVVGGAVRAAAPAVIVIAVRAVIVREGVAVVVSARTEVGAAIAQIVQAVATAAIVQAVATRVDVAVRVDHAVRAAVRAREAGPTGRQWSAPHIPRASLSDVMASPFCPVFDRLQRLERKLRRGTPEPLR